LYLRVCRLQGSQGRQWIVYTPARANRFYENFHSLLGENSSKPRADTE
jgi:hypothetical protein